MSYDAALRNSWEALLLLHPERVVNVRFLADTYTLDTQERRILSDSCNVAAKDFTAILILHYLSARLKGLPAVTGEWLDFKEIAGIEGYAAAFRQRAIEPLIRKYGNNPAGLLSVLERLPGERAAFGDAGVALAVFDGVPVLVTVWRGDEEFGPEANLLFDRSVKQIFCAEDCAVLAQMTAHAL